MESSEAYQGSERIYEVQISPKNQQSKDIWDKSVIDVKPPHNSHLSEISVLTSCRKKPKPNTKSMDGQIKKTLEITGSPTEVSILKKSDDIKLETPAGGWECLLCTGRTDDSFDVFTQTTYCGHVTLCSYICKVASLDLNPKSCGNKFACRNCYDLLNVVEQAEIEYLKHRDILVEIISQNAALKRLSADEHFGFQSVKVENFKFENAVSSDDEPLAVIKSSSNNRKNNKPKVTESEAVYDDDLTDDEDFYWALDNKEESFKETKQIKCSFKKRGRPKGSKNVKIKNESESKNPADMLIVELKEEVKQEDGAVKEEKTERPKGKRGRKKKEHSDVFVPSSDMTCTKCNKTFTSKVYYESHMSRHENAQPFICEICGKGFQSRKICDTHVRMHQGIADYKCVPCNKLFLTKFAFKRHDKIHQGKPKHQCDLCGKSFIHTSSFRMHKLIHAGIKKFSCDVCGLAMLSSSHLIRHKRIHSGEKRFECDVCGKKFSEKYNMQVHMRVHMKNEHWVPPASPTGQHRKRWFRCEHCDNKFDRLFKLEIHLVDDHKVVLKKGRPKPRNTMKKLQRAQQAAATMVSALASAMEAKRAAEQMSLEGLDVKPSVDALDENMKKGGAPGASDRKSSAAADSPANLMSSGALAARHYMQQEQMFRSAGTVWPHVTYNMGIGYLGRMADYSPEN